MAKWMCCGCVCGAYYYILTHDPMVLRSPRGHHTNGWHQQIRHPICPATNHCLLYLQTSALPDPILIELKNRIHWFYQWRRVSVCLNFPSTPFYSISLSECLCFSVRWALLCVCALVLAYRHEWMNECACVCVSGLFFTINENISIGNSNMFAMVYSICWGLPVILGIRPLVVYMPAYPTVCAPKLWPIKWNFRRSAPLSLHI